VGLSFDLIYLPLAEEKINEKGGAGSKSQDLLKGL
jgi:hypothetical protein